LQNVNETGSEYELYDLFFKEYVVDDDVVVGGVGYGIYAFAVHHDYYYY
jgi:hypothetical protein